MIWLENIAVVKTGGISLALGRYGDRPHEMIHFLSLPSGHYSAAFRKQGWLSNLNIDTEEAFLDYLSDANSTGGHLDVMRQIMKFNGALHKVDKRSKGRISAYFIQRKNTQDNEIIILVDQGKRIYQVNGPVTSAFHVMLLSNMRLSSE